MSKRKARCIAVVNEKGGVGKTAMVTNLAAVLSQKGLDVLVVDMDPQFNATRGLGVEPDDDMCTTYTVMVGEEPLDPASCVIETKWPNLYLIPAHVDLAAAEVELVEEEGRESRLNRLEPLRETYDFILLDTPPSLSILTINVFSFASEVLIPCQTHPFAYAALDDLLDTIDLVRDEINDDLSLTGVVPTFHDQRTRVSRQVMDKLKADERFTGKVFDTVIRSNITVAESAAYGKPVVFFRSTSSGSEDYANLAEELLKRG
ncbi:MAG: ParA family protein [Desulfatibacillaceae bacterium]